MVSLSQMLTSCLSAGRAWSTRTTGTSWPTRASWDSWSNWCWWASGKSQLSSYKLNNVQSGFFFLNYYCKINLFVSCAIMAVYYSWFCTLGTLVTPFVVVSCGLCVCVWSYVVGTKCPQKYSNTSIF